MQELFDARSFARDIPCFMSVGRLAEIPLVDFPPGPATDQGAHAAPQKRSQEFAAQGVRGPAKGIPAHGRSDKDAKFNHRVWLARLGAARRRPSKRNRWRPHNRARNFSHFPAPSRGVTGNDCQRWNALTPTRWLARKAHGAQRSARSYSGYSSSGGASDSIPAWALRRQPHSRSAHSSPFGSRK